MTRKFLVIGGLGFLGSELSRFLAMIAPADELHIVDLNWFSAPVPEKVVWHKKNAWDLEVADLRGFDSVVMLSALVNDQVISADMRANFRDNLALPTYVAWLAREAGVRRFVFSSTVSLYESAGDQLCTENQELQPQFPASVAKWQVERALSSWNSEIFRVIQFRLGTLCGWSARPRLDLVINGMCKTALCDGKVMIFGADVWRSPVSVSNAAEAIAEACLGTFAGSGIYNLVEGAYTLRELGEAVVEEARAAGIATQIEFKPITGPRRNFRVCGAKFRAEFPLMKWQNPRDMARVVFEHLREIPRERLNHASFHNFLQFQKDKA